MASDRNFSWAKFYTEFADRLLEHKSDRRELVAKVRDVCNSLGHSYLDNVATANPNTGLPDICPFTTMGTFNRSISTTNRRVIASELALFLGVTEPVPDTFQRHTHSEQPEFSGVLGSQGCRSPLAGL